MRYVIVCLIKGNALKFHERLVEDVCYKYNVKRQKLPAHFTIKAPFETYNIKEIEHLTENFAEENHGYPILINSTGHFGMSTVFMKVELSDGALKVYKKFIDELKKIKSLEWRGIHDGEGNNFHCTVVTHLTNDNFSNIWDYVSKCNPQFSTYFDNISILRWDKNKWITYKEYQLK